MRIATAITSEYMDVGWVLGVWLDGVVISSQVYGATFTNFSSDVSLAKLSWAKLPYTWKVFIHA